MVSQVLPIFLANVLYKFLDLFLRLTLSYPTRCFSLLQSPVSDTGWKEEGDFTSNGVKIIVYTGGEKNQNE